MSKKRFKMSRNILLQDWFIWLAFLIAIQPDLIISNTVGARIVNYCSILIFVATILELIGDRKVKVQRIFILLFFLMFSLVFSSIINSNNVSYAFRRMLTVISVCLVTHKNLRENKDQFLKNLYLIFYLCILINFITMLLYPNGIYYTYYDYFGTRISYLRHWFIGAGNNLILVFLPALFFDQLRLEGKRKWIDFLSITLWLMVLYGVVYTGAATSLIAVVLFIAFVILIERKNIPTPSLKFYIICGLIMFFLIVFFDVANVFSNVLSLLFNADITFTGRTRTWETAIEWIQQRPVFGYGYEYAANMISKFNDNTATHCHNLYLDLCYRSGIVSLVLFLMTLYSCAKPLKQYKNNRLDTLLSFTIFIYLGILFQMEAYFNMNMFYVLLIFAANIRFILFNKKTKENGVQS